MRKPSRVACHSRLSSFTAGSSSVGGNIAIHFTIRLPNSECKRFSTVDVLRNSSLWLGVLSDMRRHALFGIPAAIALVVVGVLVFVEHSRVVPLTSTELALKHVNPPASWANPDCGRLRRAVRTAMGEHGLKTAINPSHLSTDEIAVYKAVLHQWNSDGRTLNVANRTFPLDAVSSGSSCECLRNLDLQNLASASHSSHYLTRDVFPERNIRLVDEDVQRTAIQTNDPHNGMAAGKSVEKAVNDAFVSGLFSLSEIAFDRDHREALVSYGFVCGSLCGSGGTWLLEKVDGVWKKADRVCSGWVS